METKQTIERGLTQCIGTEGYHRHWSGAFVYTDGVAYLAEAADCYWLLDAIGSYRRKEPFQVWELKVSNRTAVLTMIEDTSKPKLVEQEIDYTDFPLDEITLWLIDGVLILTSEY